MRLTKNWLTAVSILLGAVAVVAIAAHSHPGRRARAASAITRQKPRLEGRVAQAPSPEATSPAHPKGKRGAAASRRGPSTSVGAPPAAQVAREGTRSESLRERFEERMGATSRGAAGGEGPLDGFADWFYSQRAFPGTIPPDARARALESAIAQNGGLRGEPGDPTAPGTPPANPTWVSIGPSNIPDGQTDDSAGPALSPVSGRLSAIAVDPTNPNVVYAGGAQGGVWKTTNALSSSPSWTPMSDHQPSLAIGDIQVDPVNPNILYAATGEGNGSCDSYYGRGILRSLNGGVTWTVLGADPGGPFDGMAVSKVLIDPTTAGSVSSTTLWASTVLGFLDSGTSACQLGPGVWNGAVWRSTDSGNTWTLQNVPTGAALPNARIHDMALDPTDPSVLYVAVRSVPTAANGGIWKSTNAKGSPATFTRLTGGFPDPVTANPGYRRITLAIGGAGANGTLFAGIENLVGSNLWALYKTTDGGTSWANVDAGVNGTASITSGSRTVTRVSGPAFTSTMVGHRIIVNNQFSRTVTSVADADHLNVRTSESAFNVSNASVSFSIGSYPNYSDGQSFYDMTEAVDPTDGTGATVYVGGNPHTLNTDLSPCPFGPDQCAHSVWRSDDGGNTWRSVSQGDGSGGLHVDDHEILLDPSTTPARVYDGNDGGIWRSENQGGSWTAMNTNITITQFQSVALHPSNPNVVIGGTQDNGTNLLNNSVVSAPAWFHSDDGDGGQSLIDQSSPSRMFHTYFNQSNNLIGPAKNVTGGTSGPAGWDFVGGFAGFGNTFANGITMSDPVQFYLPLAEHPAFSPKNVLYLGTNKLYRAPDPTLPCCDTLFTDLCGFPTPVCTNPPSWTAVSPSLTRLAGFALSAIGVVPNLISGKEAVYTGAADGRIEVSSNIDGTGVATWTVIDAAPLPQRFVTWIEVATSDPTGNTAYASFSGFNANTLATPGHVFRTTNGLSGSATWTNLSGDLPDIPVNAIAVDPSRTPNILYAGTDIGVFQSLDDGAHWAYLSEGHPVVTVFGLRRNATTGQIVSATHGRGMFQLISDGLPDTTPPICGGSVAGPNTFNGTALDAGANDTGIASIALQAGSTNLVISSIVYSGPGSATYVVSTINHCLPGSGTVVVTDFAGNTCTTAVSLTGDPSPSATITAPAFVRSASTGNAASVPDAGAGATYAWTIRSGAITSGFGTRSITFSAYFSGSVVLTVTVTSSNGCSGTSSKAIPIVVGDFNASSGSDILLRNNSTGANAVWLMSGTTVSSVVLLTPVPDTTWRIVGTADFNGDGNVDILWRRDSGDNAIWFLNGTTLIGTASLPLVTDPLWKIVATGDFNGDGFADIVWRRDTGENAVWLMNGTTISSVLSLPIGTDPLWKIVGTGDFDGDGNADILWRRNTGENVIWKMNASTVLGVVFLPIVTDPAWKIVAAGDYNADGAVDVVWRRDTGENVVWLMNGTTLGSVAPLPILTDPNWKIVGPK